MNPSYNRPTTIAQALKLKAELGPDAVFLAGGTEVNNRLAHRPVALIDLAGLALDRLEFTPDGVRMGAGVTFQQLVDHPETPWYLKQAARQMANRNIRNRATVGGHLGNNRSCADLIPTLLAARSLVSLAGRDAPLADVLAGPPELVLSVLVPSTTRSFGLAHMTRTASDISLVAVATSLALVDGRVTDPVLAMGGVAAHVVRLHDVEGQLDGHPLPEAEALEAMIANAVHPIDDQRGSADFKRQLAAVLGERALRRAVQQAGTTAGGH